MCHQPPFTTVSYPCSQRSTQNNAVSCTDVTKDAMRHPQLWPSQAITIRCCVADAQVYPSLLRMKSCSGTSQRELSRGLNPKWKWLGQEETALGLLGSPSEGMCKGPEELGAA